LESTLGVVLVLCVSAALIYAAYGLDSVATTTTTLQSGVSTISEPGYPCDDVTAIPSAAAEEEASAQFAQLSQGLCYNFVSENQTDGQASVGYTFNYYNGSVVYPCGTAPAELVVSQIRASDNGSAPGQPMFQFSNDTGALNPSGGCGSDLPPVAVVSAEISDVTIPAVPELNLTMSTEFAPQPVSSVTAVLISSVNETVHFAKVTHSSPASPGSVIYQLDIINGKVSLASGGLYRMQIEGSYSDGETFSYVAEVALVNS
jgi:hypothetical protein